MKVCQSSNTKAHKNSSLTCAISTSNDGRSNIYSSYLEIHIMIEPHQSTHICAIAEILLWHYHASWHIMLIYLIGYYFSVEWISCTSLFISLFKLEPFFYLHSTMGFVPNGALNGSTQHFLALFFQNKALHYYISIGKHHKAKRTRYTTNPLYFSKF